jgi:tRNA pseudouridine38-40 synthase
MTRIALKFAYDGTCFFGYQRQPRERTVEGDIIEVLVKIKAISDPAEANFVSASRTDRGVHAIANAAAFNTSFNPEELIGALNAKCRDILFHSYLQVPVAFNPRKAVMRHYRYLLFRCNDVVKLREVLNLFAGHNDFINFSKSGSAGRFRSIDRIDITERERWIEIDFFGRSFLHNMIRRIVSAAIMVSEGRADTGDIGLALEGRERMSFGLARPEFLILMDVDYGMKFRHIPYSSETAGRWNERLARLEVLEYLQREMPK